jgi:Ca2+/Na+ antiporter
MEQRAAGKRYVQFAAFFAVVGVLFSAFLIISGNVGGWVLLAIVACICLVGYFFVQKGKGGHP